MSGFLPRRFVLGLGVSHAPLVSDVRGHEYKKPVATMRDYLAAIDKAVYRGPAPVEVAPIVIAALRPAMIELAKSAARGVHPYLVPVEHTRRARELLGPDAWIAPEQKVLALTDPREARAVARKTLKIDLGLPNYVRNLRDFGFGDDDFKNGGSDKLVNALVAWGDERTIRERIQAHFDAGADHVCIQALRPDGAIGADLVLREVLAPG